MNTELKEKQNTPNGWKQVALGDLVSVTTGKRDANHGSPDGQYPFFTCAQTVSKIDDFSFDTEAVLIAGNGDFNVKYYKGKFDAYQRTYVLSDFKNTTGPFVYQKTIQALDDIMKNNQGSSVKFIKMGDLTDYEFSLPPIKEQQKIAEILGAVDEDIAKTQEVIDATEKLKKGLVKQLVSGHSTGSKIKIKEIAEVTSSKRVMVVDYVEEGVPFYRSTEIIKKSKNIPVTNPLYISHEKFNEFKNKFGAPEASDLLVTAVGTIGDVYLVQRGESFYFKDGNSIWIRKIKSPVLPQYLKAILASSVYREMLNNIAGGSSQKALTIQKLENVEIPIPSIAEQQKIVEILSAVDDKILVNKKLKEKLTLLKKGLMQDLLSGSKRVNI